MREVVVIGAGIGGLAAAIELQARGLLVHLIEASHEPGGKAGITHVDGIEVDTGPSVLTLPEVFADLFAAAGASFEERVDLTRPTPAFRYYYPDGVELTIHHELDATIQSVEASLGADAAKELSGFLRYARRIWEDGGAHFVFSSAPTVGSMLRMGLKNPRAFLSIDAMRSMASAIQQQVRSPHLVSLLLRYATYNGSNPHVAPATLNCISWVELGCGGFGVKGGMHQLVREMVRLAVELGVRFSFGTPVEKILVERGAATGVVTSDGTFAASAVVANADVAHVAARLLPDIGPSLAPSGELSTSGYTAVLKARRRTARAPHAVLFPENYQQEFADMFDHHRPPQDPTVYLCAQERCHQRAGWRDHEPLFVMANAPAIDDQPYPTEAMEKLAGDVRRRLVAHHLIDEADEVLWERTPRQLAARFPDTGGSLYGIASNGAMSAFRRPKNRIEQVPGLYLASGSAHPGGGVPLAALSGRAAAEALLADGIVEERRRA